MLILRSASPVDSVAATAWWQRDAAYGCDGGLASFGALYDLETGRVTDVQFNGRFSGPIRRHSDLSRWPQN
jgi:hypothetical protein